jgi:hypothetical protein
MQCVDSSEIVNGQGLEGCHFCVDCANSKFLMFCYGISNEQYMIFNKPVSQRLYDLFARQYSDFMTEFLTFAQVWPEETLIETFPYINYNFSKWYASISKKFWNWVKTLPGYDASIIYSLTFDPQFLN